MNNPNPIFVRKACLELGYVEPISIEVDGTVWLGPDNNKQYLTPQQQQDVLVKTAEIQEAAAQAAADARTSALAKLAALGLTQAEIAALLGV